MKKSRLGLPVKVIVIAVTAITFMTMFFGIYRFRNESSELYRDLNEKMQNRIVLLSPSLKKPLFDYDEQADLLFKLAGQAVEKFKTYLNDDQIMNVVQYHKAEIGDFIHAQMMEQFYCSAPVYEKPVVLPFTKIAEHNFSKYTKDTGRRAFVYRAPVFRLL
jgi:hypothetical protein